MRYIPTEIKDQVRQMIDRGEWKHSWHLKTDKWGHIDWWNQDNVNQIVRILSEDISHCLRVASKAQTLLAAIEKTRRYEIKCAACQGHGFVEEPEPEDEPCTKSSDTARTITTEPESGVSESASCGTCETGPESF